MSAAFRPQREPLVPPGGVEMFARDMTVTVAADVSLDELQRRLADIGQWLPIDGDPKSPVGQLVEQNSTGPLRLGYGAWRDLLLGCQFTNGRGELITAGGRVVKNVAGYDLTKLMVGQRGVFGRIVTVTTRTYRKPTAYLSAVFEPDVANLQALLPTACRPQWAVLHDASLVCGYVGDEALIAFVESALPRWGPRKVSNRQNWAQDLVHRGQFWRNFLVGVPFRASVPPGRIREFVTAAGCGDWIADPAFGMVRGAGEDWTGVRAAAIAVGGSAWREGPAGADDLGSDAQRHIIQKLAEAFGSAVAI